MPFSSLQSKEIENSLKKANTGILLLYNSTIFSTTAPDKKTVSIPYPISTLIEKIKKETKKPNVKKKTWLLKKEEYNKLIKNGTFTSLPTLLQEPFDKEKIKPLTYLFLNDCMTILKPLYKKFGPVSVRVLYYQLVTGKTIESSKNSYTYFNKALTEGRKQGYIPWEMFMDDTKPFYPAVKKTSLDTLPYNYIIDRLELALTKPYTFDLWEKQNTKVEVWIEKNALIPIIKPITDKWNVALQSLRGYSSYTKLREGVERVNSYIAKGLKVRLFYFGDFDPAGWYIYTVLKRYFKEGMNEINKKNFRLIRLAVNPRHLKTLTHDPLPVKEGDKNRKNYIKRFKKLFERLNMKKSSCYEIEAMDPAEIQKILATEIQKCISVKLDEEKKNRWYEEFEKLKTKALKILNDEILMRSNYPMDDNGEPE